MEDDLKILKVGHLSNHLLDPTKILNLSLDYEQNYLQILDMKAIYNGRQSKYQKGKSQQPLYGS